MAKKQPTKARSRPSVPRVQTKQSVYKRAAAPSSPPWAKFRPMLKDNRVLDIVDDVINELEERGEWTPRHP